MPFQNKKASIKRQAESYERLTKSPVFSFSNSGTIETSAPKNRFLVDYHRDKTASEKYGSFNNLRVSNNSTSGILAYPNQNTDNGVFVSAGTTEVIDSQLFGSTTSLLIENVGSASITANQIRVSIWKDNTEIQSIASRLHEKFFAGEKNPFRVASFGFKRKLGEIV